MAEKITIRKIFRDPVNTKFGPGTRTSIFAVEYPDVRMSSFSKGAEGWKEGDEVMIEIKKNGEFTNYKVVDSNSKASVVDKKLEDRVTALERAVGITSAPTEPVIEAGDSSGNDW